MQAATKIPPYNYLSENEWQALLLRDQEKLNPIVSAHRERAVNNEKHPVIDFLFDYYHFKPTKLLQWSPGIGCYLLGPKAQKFLTLRGFNQDDNGVYIDSSVFPNNRLTGLQWTINLLSKTLENKPQFNCFGLHEWCMVYESRDIRHPQLPLRLSHQQTREIVEQHSIQCTHYDAYRFYSTTALNFNKLKLNRDSMSTYEQPGCLHTNMDLYRWAYKYHPWIPSELITATFLLALQIREVDMRASPYDVSRYTNKPAIKIETTRGKSEYVESQKEFARRAQPLRKQLLKRLVELQKELVNSN